jgi:hypothetical protein
MPKRGKCVGAGMSLQFWAKSHNNAMVVFPENVRGYARPESLRVPHSELGMHVGAAGRPLLAWACDRDDRSCAIAYAESDGGGGRAREVA